MLKSIKVLTMNYFYVILIISGYLICVDGNTINSFIIDGTTSPVQYVRRIRSIRNEESTQASLFTGFFISESVMLTAAQALNKYEIQTKFNLKNLKKNFFSVLIILKSLKMVMFLFRRLEQLFIRISTV